MFFGRDRVLFFCCSCLLTISRFSFRLHFVEELGNDWSLLLEVLVRILAGECPWLDLEFDFVGRLIEVESRFLFVGVGHIVSEEVRFVFLEGLL